MPKTYYQILNVSPNADAGKIKKAYYELALIYHPDRGGDTKVFQEIQGAYQILSDKQQRQIYDNQLLGRRSRYEYDSFSYYQDLGLSFSLPRDLDSLNNYEYCNALFNLQGHEQIGPGTLFDSQELYNKVNYVKSKIYMDAPSDYGLTLKEIRKHQRKTFFLLETIFRSEKYEPKQARRLYDISLGYYATKEDQEIADAVGGPHIISEGLKNFISLLSFPSSVFILHQAGILTRANYQVWTRNNRSTATFLEYMRQAKLLTQSNFDLLFSCTANDIFWGVLALGVAKILTQKSFEQIVLAGRQGLCVAYSLKGLHEFNLFTPETEEVALHKIKKIKMIDAPLYEKLLGLKKKKQWPAHLTNVLHWSPPEPFSDIGTQLNRLFAHGLFLLTVKPSLGEKALLLALELKSDLRAFLALSAEEQNQTKAAFRSNFRVKLHSQDKDMSIHRAYWKVLIANILITLTGLGLFALGVHYLATKKGFFSQTHREKCIEQLEHDILRSP